MTKIAYLECQTGIAGDMCLGALVDAGVPIEYLNTQLSRLGIASEYHLWAEQVHRNGQLATKVHVDLTAITTAENTHSHPHPHDRSHTHSHPHEHPHPPHSHPHPHEHHHPHPHSHAGEHLPVDVGEAEASLSENCEYFQEHPHPHSHPLSPSPTPPLSPSPTPPLSHTHHHHDFYDTPQRNLPEIERLINGANLPARAARWSLEVFRQLAIAEGAVHGIDPSEVHFHEVGAVDAIVDIVGTCLGLDYLDITKLYCSPLPTGGGTVRAAHGVLPVPVPAVLKLFASRQVPVYSNQIDRELVTPTGAAIAVTLAAQFGTPPAMQIERIGLGAGTIELPLPNIIRLWVGVESKTESSPVRAECIDRVEVLSTQIDDLNPQAIGYIFDRLFSAGALDVFTQPIGMKKSRPGILLTVICPPELAIACEQIIFTETSTLGIRRNQQERSILPRELVKVTTPYGEVRVKIARNNLVDNNQIINVRPEYEDCAAIATERQVAWQEVERAAIAAWHDREVYST